MDTLAPNQYHDFYFPELFYQSIQPMVVMYPGQSPFFNPAFCELLGYTEEELQTAFAAGKFPRKNDEVYKHTMRELLRTRKPILLEDEYIHKDDKSIPIEMLTQVALEADGSVRFFYGFVFDISERKRAEEALRRSEALYRAVVEDQIELICRFRPDFTLTFVNEAVCRFIGLPRDELVGKNLLLLVPVNIRDELARDLASMGRGKPICIREDLYMSPEGNARWLQWRNRAILNDQGELVEYQSVGWDITDRRRMEERLRSLGLRDALTGLHNRAYFEDTVRRVEEGRYRRAGILVCDLDGLKLVNDTMGHLAGDQLLNATAEIIKKCFRGDDVVTRIGGDEFAVIIPGCDRNALERGYRRVVKAVDQYNQKNPDLPLSISIGYSLMEKPNKPLPEAFREADDNMYREKLHHSRSARSVIVRTLMRALEERDFITQGHAVRMQKLVTVLGEAARLTGQKLADLQLLAQFHDIGKVAVPDQLLFKPGRLDEAEFERMKRHSESGHRIALASPDLSHIADWILKHHEWWDGSGYPLGLRGEEIPLECRILAIADAFDAMTSNRPYRKAMPMQDAIEELERGAGIQFDPELVDVFTQVWAGFEAR
ncbi:MAG: diguanylate cyclase [Firmicutes bacterium]|nr:diguanylate cyclase [Bacillota bacterium]